MCFFVFPIKVNLDKRQSLFIRPFSINLAYLNIFGNVVAKLTNNLNIL